MSLKKLRTFPTTWEAGMAQSLLEAEGIHALVDGAMLPFRGAPQEGVKLLVEESEFDRAEAILAD